MGKPKFFLDVGLHTESLDVVGVAGLPGQINDAVNGKVLDHLIVARAKSTGGWDS